MATSVEKDTVDLLPALNRAGARQRAVAATGIVDVAGLSHPGKVRTENEDHFLIARFGRFLECVSTNLADADAPPRFEEIGYGLIVADGIGGNPAGEEASKRAITTLVELAEATPDWIMRIDESHLEEEAMRRAADRFQQVTATLTKQANANRELSGFGTTLTLAATRGRYLLLTHLGDSRAYLIRRGVVERLTHDHTIAQELANYGIIGQDEVATHRRRHSLTRAVGDRCENSRPDVQSLLLADGDTLLLCTDGLTEMVGDQRIAAVVAAAPSAQFACEQLVNDALDAGGRDNVTVIVARYPIS